MDAINTGGFICKLRKEKGLTQAALAEKLNISNRTVSKWENGDGFPDITILPELSEALGVSVDELLKGERAEKAVKVTEVKSKENVDNLFMVAYVISLFVGGFAAFLGGVTEVYSIWAFRILFYTHWEILFAAAALFSTALSSLIFAVGVTRLGIAYNREEVKEIAAKKLWLLTLILSVFPFTFVMRLVDVFIPAVNVWLVMTAAAVVLTAVFYFAYRKINKR